MLSRRQFLAGLPASLGLQGQESSGPARIRMVDIFHHCHTDIGYTDSPSVARDMQRRFLDAALDACLRDQRFRWTAEAMINVDDWWHASSNRRRHQLIERVRAGQIDITALPFNQAPFLNAARR